MGVQFIYKPVFLSVKEDYKIPSVSGILSMDIHGKLGTVQIYNVKIDRLSVKTDLRLPPNVIPERLFPFYFIYFII